MSMRELLKISKYPYKGNFYARFDTRGVLTPFDSAFLVSSPIRKNGIFFVGHKTKDGYTISLYRIGMKFKTYSTKTDALKNFAHNINHYTFDQIERAADSNHDLNTIHPSRAVVVSDPGADIKKNPQKSHFRWMSGDEKHNEKLFKKPVLIATLTDWEGVKRKVSIFKVPRKKDSYVIKDSIGFLSWQIYTMQQLRTILNVSGIKAAD